MRVYSKERRKKSPNFAKDEKLRNLDVGRHNIITYFTVNNLRSGNINRKALDGRQGKPEDMIIRLETLYSYNGLRVGRSMISRSEYLQLYKIHSYQCYY